MRFVRRVVIDTSTLIGAVLLPDSIPQQALQEAVVCGELCASKATLQELESVIRRPKFNRYLPLDARSAFVTLVRREAHLFAVTAEEEAVLPRQCRDPRDNKFLALALACEADAIVSSDTDLLTLNPYEGISVLRPREFLDTMQSR